MIISTRHFGQIEVTEEKILTFEDGIPAFESVKKFILIDNENKESLFRWLQCVDEPSLAFTVVNPFVLKQDYDISLDDETINTLEIEKPEDVLIYAIVVVPEDMTQISMNLKAPVIINTKNNKGAQVILDTDKYSVRHYIVKELREQEVNNNACSDKEEGAINNNK